MSEPSGSEVTGILGCGPANDADGRLAEVAAQEGSALVEVEAIQEALQRYGHLLPTDDFNELRRNCHTVAARLESAERRLAQLGIVIDWRERAEAAEGEAKGLREAHALHVEEDGRVHYCAVCDAALTARTEERA